jgi:NAD dependent epimerase/dehydratase family enzyme
LRVPRLALKAATGELSGELLGSLRVRPQRLLDSGFAFEHPDVGSIVGSALAD